MTFFYDKKLVELAHEILMGAGKPYTDEQLKEIPNILNAKSRYFWGNDLNDWELLRDVFTEEGLEGFRAYWSGGGGGPITVEGQINSVKWSIGPQENMVPMHFGHNQVVRFLDATHAQLLTRMRDRHVYNDNGEVCTGYGLYVDDLLKCADGEWRISTIRLNYGVLEGQLRCIKNMKK